jgi:hypothetical protein
MRDILADDGIIPDFSFSSSQDSTYLDYIHRRTDSADIYLVVNRLARKGIYDTKYRYSSDLPDRYEMVDCRFRITGKKPEIWDPLTGEISDVPVYREEQGATIVPLFLNPEGSVFVLFRETAEKSHITSCQRNSMSVFPVTSAPAGSLPPVRFFADDAGPVMEVFEAGEYLLQNSDGQTTSYSVERSAGEIHLEGAWEVRFPEARGAPESILLPELISWTQVEDAGVRYFSGTAEYVKAFALSDALFENSRLYLDLGNVQELAGIVVNEQSLGVLWMPPFRSDITRYVNPGKNELRIRVTNLWPNRLIGDQSLPPEKRFTRTNIQKFSKDDPLRISGLLGPVRIYTSRILPVNF